MLDGYFYFFIIIIFFFFFLAHPGGLESGVHNVGMRVHGVLHHIPVVRRRHPSAMGQSVQRPDQLGAQEEQEAERQEDRY